MRGLPENSLARVSVGGMRILLLGGIGEAIWLVRRLAPLHAVTYSVAGRGRIPALPCPVRVGGFGGVAGLAGFLEEGGIELLIDATHPYAAQMSRHAAMAATEAGVSRWAYRRPPWQPQSGDDWRLVTDWPAIQAAIDGFRRPFFTLGLEPLQHAEAIPPHQHWLVRCLAAATPSANLTVLSVLGPFAVEQELELLRAHAIDVLVAKNSGGHAVAAKLAAARELRIPVVMLERPPLPPAEREFGDIGMLAADLGC